MKNDVGILKYEKGVNSSNLNLLFNNGTKFYDLVISSKFVNYNNDNKMNTKIVFKNKIIFDNNISAPCVFKIVFDDNNNIISIENINIH